MSLANKPFLSQGSALLFLSSLCCDLWLAHCAPDPVLCAGPREGGPPPRCGLQGCQRPGSPVVREDVDTIRYSTRRSSPAATVPCTP